MPAGVWAPVPLGALRTELPGTTSAADLPRICAIRARPSNGILALGVALRGDIQADTAFTRADLVIEGVPHRALSHDVHLFVNAPQATAATARGPTDGHGGRISAFGHGAGFGGAGPCDPTRAPTDPRPDALAVARPPPLTARHKIFTGTEPLRHALADGGPTSITYTVRCAPPRSDCEPAAGLFSFDRGEHPHLSQGRLMTPGPP